MKGSWRWLAAGGGAILLSALALVKRTPDPVVQGRPASEWAGDLLSSDYRVRGEAESALLALGEAGVPQIRELLRRRTPFWHAPADRLSGLFPFVKPKAGDPGLSRLRGAEMIARLGPAGRGAIPELIRTLNDPQAAGEAERALTRAGDPSAPALARALRDRRPEVRARSARLLKEFLPRHEPSIPPLIRALLDPEPSVRKNAAATLGVAVRGRPETAAALLSAAGDAAPEVRAAAFESLGQSGPSGPPLLEALERGMRDPFPAVRLEAAKAHWKLTQDPGQVVPVLAAILETQENWQAAYALAEIGPAAAPAVPALIEVLKKERVPRVFRTPPSSAFALGRIQEPAIPALEEVLASREPAVRLAALLAFGFMGGHARAAVPRLAQLLKDPEAEVRHVAAITLAGIGAEREVVLEGLSACLNAEDIYLRSAAAAHLREIAPEKDWAVPAE